MSDPIRKVIDALVALAKTMPEVTYVSVTFRERAPSVHLESRSDQGAQVLAERLGVKSLRVMSSSADHWLHGHDEGTGVTISVSGPMHRAPKPIDEKKIDRALDLAGAAVAEVQS